MKVVTEDEFQKFLKEYPNKLEKDIVRMVEPPIQQYNDFSNGKVWPESVVAQVHLSEPFVFELL